MSQLVAELESLLGFRLFDRTTRRVELSGGGRSLLPMAQSWVLWCTAGHRLARKRVLRWADLREVPLVAAGRDPERSVAQMQLSAPEGARITPVEVVDNVSTALGIAAQGVVCTLAPAYVAVLARHFGLVQRRVVDPETVRKVCLYTPGGTRSLSPAAEGLAAHLTAWLPRWHKASRSG